MVGSAVRYLYTGDAGDLLAASFFWDTVVQHHSYATGGHGMNEYFGRPDELGARVDGRTSESCNVYNMLKLTRLLFSLHPDAHYVDFLERALFNHVLGSIDPEDGRMCYMVPVGRAVQREYQDMFRSFTCCVGSGMENHALHSLGLYYESGDKLWINIYAPSTAEWTSQGARLKMETDFPEGESVKISIIMEKPKELVLALRRPWWVTGDFLIKINGQALPAEAMAPPSKSNNPQYIFAAKAKEKTSYYVEVKRQWKTGDVIELTLPKALHLEPTPDASNIVAIMWGPLVLAGDLGPERERPRRTEGAQPASKPDVPRPVSPFLVAAPRPVNEWLKPVADKPGVFRLIGVGRTLTNPEAIAEVDLVPFYRLHRRIYSGYWDYIDEEEWAKRLAAYRAEKERKKSIEAATLVLFQPGETKVEKEFNFQAGERIVSARVMGRESRRGPTWFSCDLPTQGETSLVLLVTYYTDDRQPEMGFYVLAGGEKISQEKIERSPAPRFIEKEYPLPGKLLQGKAKITIGFQAQSESEIAPVVEVRLLRK